jgi:hypothetical protein
MTIRNRRRVTLRSERRTRLAGTHNYKPGDTVLLIPFADRPVLSKDITVFNSLSLLGECQKTEREIGNKQPGTSLILLLERINAAIQEQRDKKNLNPAVATILIDDAEPGPSRLSIIIAFRRWWVRLGKSGGLWR